MNPAKQDHIESSELSRSLVYLVSPRGGNNYWARVINGCDKIMNNSIGTLRVSIAQNGRWILEYDDNFVNSLSIEMRKLVLVHEAGHLAQRHIERYMKLLSCVTDPKVREALDAIYNIAMDFADNDVIVRQEKEFAEAIKQDPEGRREWIGLLPEDFGLPRGKSFEGYVSLIIDHAVEINNMLDKMVEQMEKQGQKGQGQGKGKGGKSGKGQKGNEAGGGGGAGEEDSDQDPTDQAAGVPQGAPSDTDLKDETDQDGVPNKLPKLAKDNPKLFQQILQNFHKVTKNAHKQWNDIGRRLTPEEAISLANKMKQHTRQLVKSAHEQTTRARGFIPGYVQGIIQALLAPEQIPWTVFFRDEIQGKVTAKVLEAMACPNVSMINDDFVEPWPGYILDVEFNIIWVTDTSGSVGDGEYARACAEVNNLMKVNKNIHLRIIQIDAAIQRVEDTDNVQPPEDSAIRKRYGYGGTVYTPAFKYICGQELQQEWAPDAWANKPIDPCTKPDLVIVYSDGGVVIEGEVLPQWHPGAPIIWLLAPGCQPAHGMSNAPPDKVIQMFDMGVHT